MINKNLNTKKYADFFSFKRKIYVENVKTYPPEKIAKKKNSICLSAFLNFIKE